MNTNLTQIGSLVIESKIGSEPSFARHGHGVQLIAFGVADGKLPTATLAVPLGQPFRTSESFSAVQRQQLMVSTPDITIYAPHDARIMIKSNGNFISTETTTFQIVVPSYDFSFEVTYSVTLNITDIIGKNKPISIRDVSMFPYIATDTRGSRAMLKLPDSLIEVTENGTATVRGIKSVNAALLNEVFDQQNRNTTKSDFVVKASAIVHSYKDGGHCLVNRMGTLDSQAIEFTAYLIEHEPRFFSKLKELNPTMDQHVLRTYFHNIWGLDFFNLVDWQIRSRNTRLQISENDLFNLIVLQEADFTLFYEAKAYIQTNDARGGAFLGAMINDIFRAFGLDAFIDNKVSGMYTLEKTSDDEGYVTPDQIQISENVKQPVNVSTPTTLERVVYDEEVKYVDGDSIVTFPDAPEFWVEGKWFPYDSEEHMHRAFNDAFEKYLAKEPNCYIFFNAGAKFIKAFPEMISGMVVISKTVLAENINQREKAGNVKRQPCNFNEVLAMQEQMEKVCRNMDLPIYHGFTTCEFTFGKRGVIVATSGAGKSTFVAAQSEIKARVRRTFEKKEVEVYVKEPEGEDEHPWGATIESEIEWPMYEVERGESDYPFSMKKPIVMLGGARTSAELNYTPKQKLCALQMFGLRNIWFVDGATPDMAELKPGQSLHALKGEGTEHYEAFDHTLIAENVIINKFGKWAVLNHTEKQLQSFIRILKSIIKGDGEEQFKMEDLKVERKQSWGDIALDEDDHAEEVKVEESKSPVWKPIVDEADVKAVEKLLSESVNRRLLTPKASKKTGKTHPEDEGTFDMIRGSLGDEDQSSLIKQHINAEINKKTKAIRKTIFGIGTDCAVAISLRNDVASYFNHNGKEYRFSLEQIEKDSKVKESQYGVRAVIADYPCQLKIKPISGEKGSILLNFALIPEDEVKKDPETGVTNYKLSNTGNLCDTPIPASAFVDPLAEFSPTRRAGTAPTVHFTNVNNVFLSFEPRVQDLLSIKLVEGKLLNSEDMLRDAIKRGIDNVVSRFVKIVREQLFILTIAEQSSTVFRDSLKVSHHNYARSVNWIKDCKFHVIRRDAKAGSNGVTAKLIPGNVMDTEIFNIKYTLECNKDTKRRLGNAVHRHSNIAAKLPVVPAFNRMVANTFVEDDKLFRDKEVFASVDIGTIKEILDSPVEQGIEYEKQEIKVKKLKVKVKTPAKNPRSKNDVYRPENKKVRKHKSTDDLRNNRRGNGGNSFQRNANGRLSPYGNRRFNQYNSRNDDRGYEPRQRVRQGDRRRNDNYEMDGHGQWNEVRSDRRQRGGNSPRGRSQRSSKRGGKFRY
jgi:hypothetical protein